MARARNIKPSFFTNEDLVELPFEDRLLFIGLWTLADREGRLEDRPKRIKMAVFPADNVDVDAQVIGGNYGVRNVGNNATNVRVRTAKVTGFGTAATLGTVTAV